MWAINYLKYQRHLSDLYDSQNRHWCNALSTINRLVFSIGMYSFLYTPMVGKPEGKRPMGRPRRGWEANIKMDLQEVGGGCGDWMELAQDRDR